MEKDKLKSKEKAGLKNINQNCWIVRIFKIFPFSSCRYCEMKLGSCPFFKFLLITAISIPLFLALIFLIEGEIPVYLFFFLLVLIFLYGRLFGKTTEELILSSFSFKGKREDLEESEIILKIRVKAKTRQLQELSDSLEKQVEEKTKEIQDRLTELERFHKLTIGRELRMIEIKKEMKKMEKELYEAQKNNQNKKIEGESGEEKK